MSHGVLSFADYQKHLHGGQVRGPVSVSVPALLDTAQAKVTLSSTSSMASEHEQHCSEKFRLVYGV
jgi:hypothetical protein